MFRQDPGLDGWLAPFPAKLTASEKNVDDVWLYSWTEQVIDSTTGEYTNASPARSGTATNGPALELNNADIDVAGTPVVWMRLRGFASDSPGNITWEFDGSGLVDQIAVVRIDSLTLDGDGYYPSSLAVWDAVGLTWSYTSGIKTLAANGETLLLDLKYLARNAGRTNADEALYITVAPRGPEVYCEKVVTDVRCVDGGWEYDARFIHFDADWNVIEVNDTVCAGGSGGVLSGSGMQSSGLEAWSWMGF